MSEQPRDVEHAVQLELTRMTRRFVPPLILLGLLCTTLALTPPPAESAGRRAAALGQESGGTGGGSAVADGGSSSSAELSSGPVDGAIGPATSDAGGGQTPARGPGSSGGVAGSPGSAAAAVARSGVTCRSGVRQVSWTPYAPPCVAKYTGSNGGATSYGVTKDTITVTFRFASSAQLAAYQSAVGASANSTGADLQQTLADLQTYFKVFNRNYELYGRQVVIKPFNGSGDVILEHAGEGASGAQQDAATAKDNGAFADVSVIAMSQLYAEALASQKVVSFANIYMSQKWFDDHAPYGYGFYPANDKLAEFAGSTVCQRMAGLKASFAGDAATQAKTRVFGLINPENAVYAAGGEALVKRLSRCGADVAARVSYSVNPSTLASEMNNAVLQMQQAGVTTVICLCDLTAPQHATKAADAQNYHPEWYQAIAWPDPTARKYSQDQWSHAIYTGGRTASQGEAFRVYRMGNPSGPPSGDYAYPIAYRQAALIFNALQAAGPNLTPANLARGLAAQQSNPTPGEWGAWTFGPRVYAPTSSFQLGWWSATAPSGLDGQAGAIQNCEAGRWFGTNATIGRQSTQLACFGKS